MSHAPLFSMHWLPQVGRVHPWHGLLMQVVESTGIVMAPYKEFPQLLSFLLLMLSEGAPTLRLAVLKVSCLCK